MSYPTINLQDYRTPGSNVFTGRDRGKYVRNQSNIDQLEVEHNKVKIIIPSDIWSVNPSFLEEFLDNVVGKLNKEGFYKKFDIVNEGEYKIDSDLDEAIDRILQDEIALI